MIRLVSFRLIMVHPNAPAVRRVAARAFASSSLNNAVHHPSRYSDTTFVAGRPYSSAADATHLPPVLPSPTSSSTISGGNNPTNVAATATGSKQIQKKSIMTKLWDRYSIGGQQNRIKMAESLFQAATKQASDPRWFGPGRIGREFRPRHALLTMHVWFLHKRLIADTLDKELALMIQEELFNILWMDTTCRIRQQGVNELLVNKNLLQVQQYTFMHLTHYDHAYTEFLTKPAERIKELRKIVWQHILVRDEDAEQRYDHLDRIAWYIEAQYQNIMLDWPDEYYRDARVAWIDLPDFTDLKDADGKVMDPNPIHPDDVLPEPWERNITNRGIEYYWNRLTMQSTWTRPTSETVATTITSSATTNTMASPSKSK